MPDTLLQINNLYKRFLDKEKQNSVLEDVSLSVTEGEIVSIIGPSGCGKSTLLRIVGGLDADYEGQVLFEGKETRAPSRERGFIFQDYRLLPWLTVEENIKFSLPEGLPEKNKVIQKMLEVVGLTQAAKNYPGQLSGGMAGRVAIARALANQPRLLLLDEPFGALDAMTKMRLQDEMLQLWKKSRITMMIVTHDIDEAVYLGNRVIVMAANPGKIHRIYHIDHDDPRSRTSSNFHHQRDKIYREFFQEKTPEFSYSI